MISDMCPLLQDQAAQLHSPKNPVLHLFIPLFLEHLATTDLFPVSLGLPFPECHIQLTLKQRGFELRGSTYMWICSHSKYRSTTSSVIGCIPRCGTVQTEGPWMQRARPQALHHSSINPGLPLKSYSM